MEYLQSVVKNAQSGSNFIFWATISAFRVVE